MDTEDSEPHGEDTLEDTPTAIANEHFKGSPVVGYVRSAKIGDPRLDEWEAEIRAYCAQRGYNLVEVVRDEGVSGVAVWKPGLEEIIHEMETSRYHGVVLITPGHLAQSDIAAQRALARIHDKGAWTAYTSDLV